MGNPIFDKSYYESIMKEHNYDPLEFGYFDFGLKSMPQELIAAQYLCHFHANKFAQGLNANKKAIVTTGFGMSGAPHMGTLSQIMRIIKLHSVGIQTQIVLGDLDAYNGKNKSLEYVLEIKKRYIRFINKLGYGQDSLGILRDQYSEKNVIQTMYLIGKYMDDKMFEESEEDLHGLYVTQNKVDAHMSYRRKLSLALMTADFIELGKEFEYVNILLGIDEHKYVKFALKTLENIKQSNDFPQYQKLQISSMYTKLLKGFNGYPKQSKSFPESSIHTESSVDDIKQKVFFGDCDYSRPEESTVFQMMCELGNYSLEQLQLIEENCRNKNSGRTQDKSTFCDYLISIIEKW